MIISEILAPERILCDVKVASKKSALETMSQLIATSDSLLNYTDIFDSLNSRERLGSTGLGNGIAIPHARIKGITGPLAAFLQLSEAIDFDAVDKKPVDLLFGLVVPIDSTEEHLKILSCIAEKCCNKDLLDYLRVETSPEKIYESLSR